MKKMQIYSAIPVGATHALPLQRDCANLQRDCGISNYVYIVNNDKLNAGFGVWGIGFGRCKDMFFFCKIKQLFENFYHTPYPKPYTQASFSAFTIIPQFGFANLNVNIPRLCLRQIHPFMNKWELPKLTLTPNKEVQHENQ